MLTRTDRRRFPILLAVIAALAMAMLFSPVQAQEAETLVSNLDTSSGSSVLVQNNEHAQQFQTGSGATVQLSDVAAHTNGGSSNSSNLGVSLWSSVSGAPGEKLATFTNPSNMTSAGVKTFTNPGPGALILQPGTPYFVVFSFRDTTGRFALGLNEVSEETGLSGWTVADFRRTRSKTRPLSGSWTSDSSDLPVGIRLRGSLLDGPALVGLEITSNPPADGNYTTGDVIEVTATFSEALAVDTTSGTPRLALTVGSNTRYANYSSSDSTGTALVFAYPVATNDRDNDGVSIVTDALELNGGAIHKQGDTSTDALLSHGALSAQSDHRVNADAFIVDGGVAVTSSPAVADTYGSGETIEISVTFSEAVNATSATDFVLSVSGPKRAALLRGSGTRMLVFGYAVQATDSDTNGIWIGDQNRTLVGNRNGDPQNGEITSAVTDRAADLTHGEIGTLSGHKVDGTQQAPQVTIAADQTAFTAELDAVTFTLTRTGSTAAALTADVVLTQDQEFLLSENLTQSVTFESGESTAALVIEPRFFVGHEVTEDGTLTATVQAGTGYVPGTEKAASTSILVTSPAVTVRLEEASYTFDEDGASVVALVATTLSGVPSPNRFFDVSVSALSGTASSPYDYDVFTVQQSFQPSDFGADGTVFTARLELPLTLVDDALDEPDETFTVALQLAPSTPPVVGLRQHDGTACVPALLCSATATITDNDPQPTLSVAPAQAEEGEDLTFTVTLSAESGREVTVDWTANAFAAAGDSATADTDFTAGTGTLTFTPRTDGVDDGSGDLVTTSGETAKTFTVATTEDETVEEDETFTVGLSNPSNAEIEDGNAKGTIENDDVSRLVSNTGQTGDVQRSEATFAQRFTIGSSAAASKYILAGVDVVSGGTDGFTAQVCTVNTNGYPTSECTDLTPPDTFAAGTMSFAAPMDTTLSKGTTYTVLLGATVRFFEFAYTTSDSEDSGKATGWSIRDEYDFRRAGETGWNQHANRSVRIAIKGTAASDTPAALPTLSIADAAATEGDDMEFTVTLSAADAADVTATWTASIETGDTAVAADLGTTKTGTVTVAMGNTTGTFTVSTVEDSTVEVNETFTVTLTGPSSNAQLSSTAATAQGTINNDDLATVSVADAEGDEDEGVEFTLTLSAAAPADVTVDWTASIEFGNSASTADLATTKTGTVTITKGATTKKFTVPVNADTTDESDQTFTVTLSNPTPTSLVELAADPTAEGTIDDDDDPPTLTVADLQHDENDSSAAVLVSLSEVSEKRVRFKLRQVDRTEDTASDADWSPNSSTEFQSISAGTMSGTRVAVSIVHDTLDEDDETLTVEAYNLQNATGSAADREATITIVDDDPTPTVTVADASATEGDKVEFVVTLSAVSGRDVEVGYATSVETGDTAVSGTDFTEATGTLTILAADSTDTGTVEVQTTDDDASESAETFTLTLSATKNVALGTPSTATGTINDETVTLPTLSVGNASATEGALIRFPLTLSAAASENVTVSCVPSFGSSDTAVAADLTGGTSTTTIFIGATSGSCSIRSAQDTIDEEDETFTVTLSNPSSNAQLATDPTATGTILDDDTAPTVTGVAITSTPVLETDTYGAGETIRVTVTFSEAVTVTGDPEFAFSLDSGEDRAPYKSGSGTTALVFAYTVAPGDEDDDGIFLFDGSDFNNRVGPVTLDSDDAIKSTGSTTDADLAHTGRGTESGHKVDGSRSIVSVEVTSTPQLESDTYGAGETILFTVTFTAKVDVTGDPVLEFLFDGSEVRQASDVSGDGTTELVFSYTVVSGDDDDNGLFLRDESDYNNPDGPVRLDSDDEIEFHGTSTDAPLYWAGRGTQSGHKVDGSRTTGNVAPSFSSSATISVAENQTTVVTVVAMDSDTDDNVTGYAITGGADQSLFSIGATSGDLTFNDAPNFENLLGYDNSDNTYEVTVQATSGTGARVKTATQTITVTVTDVEERPAKPAKPTLAQIPASSTTLRARWAAPDLDGGPHQTGYEVQYRQGATGMWLTFDYTQQEISIIITGLMAETEYQVRVQVETHELDSEWSDPSDTVSTNAEPPPCTLNTDDIWCSVLGVEEGDGPTIPPGGNDPGTPKGYCGPDCSALDYGISYGHLVDKDFTLDGTPYTILAIRWGAGDNSQDHLYIELDPLPWTDITTPWTLQIGSDSFSFADAWPLGGGDEYWEYWFNNAYATLTPPAIGSVVTVRLNANVPPSVELSGTRLGVMYLEEITGLPTSSASDSYVRGNRGVNGLWSDGTTLWVADGHSNQARFHQLDCPGGDGCGVPMGPDVPSGSQFTEDGKKIHHDTIQALTAYDLGGGYRVPALDMPNTSYLVYDDLDTASGCSGTDRSAADPGGGGACDGLVGPEGVWSDGDVVWVSDVSRVVKAYRVSSFAEKSGPEAVAKLLPDRSLTMPARSVPRGIWSDGTTIWVVDAFRDERVGVNHRPKLVAFDLASGNRNSDRDITGLNGTPEGVWSDGVTLWVSTSVHSGPDNDQVGRDKVLAYEFHPEGGEAVRDEDRDLSLRNHSHATGLWSDGERMWVGDGGPAVHVYCLDRAASCHGAQKRSTDATIALPYTAGNFDLSSDNADPGATWSDDTTLWALDVTDKKIYTYALSDGTADTSALSLATDNADPAGMWSDGTTIWVSDSDDDKLYAYTMDPWDRDGGSDFSLMGLNAADNSLGGVWSDGAGTIWVAHRSTAGSGRATAFNTGNGSLDTDRTFDLSALNSNPAGMWSDGRTMWLLDTGAAKVFAYDLDTGRSRPHRYVDALTARFEQISDTAPTSVVGIESPTGFHVGESGSGGPRRWPRSLPPQCFETHAEPDADGNIVEPDPPIAPMPPCDRPYGRMMWVVDGQNNKVHAIRLHPALFDAPAAESENAGSDNRSAPPPPDNVRAVTQKSGAVALTWEAPDGAAVTGYRIERRRAGEDLRGSQSSDGRPRDQHTLVEDTGSADTGYTDKSAEEGVDHEYRISARNEAGPGEGSDWVRAGPEPVWGDGPPGAPRNLTVAPGNKEITLSWEPPDENGNPPATRYRIEWRMDGKDYKKGHWGTSGSTTYTKTDLANGVKYVFRVKAENGSGNSYGPYGPASEEVSATPTSGSAVDLGTPVLSNTKTLHHGMVRLDWEDIEDAGWYVVQYYHVKSGEWLDLPAAGVDIAFHGSSAVVSNLHGLSWLRVRAMSCAGESEWSQIEELYGTKASDWEDVPVPEVAEGDQIEPCPVILGTPVLSNTKTLHHGMVRLDWEDIEDAGWYVVQYYHVKSGEWLDLPAAGVDIAFHGSGAVVSNLHGLSWLRVRAMSCAGESEWSQIEELYGTKASDWEGVPVPEVAEGDEIEPCDEDVDTPDNSPATGAPAIGGTVQVGETLTADTSGVADADGLTNATFSYQWLADDSDISGATNATYTLAAADEGKTIKVQVSFTDDAGNEETLTSAATDSVSAAPQPNNPATGAPTISGTAQVGETLTANTSEVADVDGLSNVQYEYQWLADDADISGATNATYTLADTDEGKAIKVRVSFADDAGNGETLTSGATDAVAAAPTPNSPATGAPTITGTAQVGEALTATTSGVIDEDGLEDVSFTYRWLSDDAEIAGVTSSTYTLVVADENKAIKVEVTFIDDAGNDESLTSAATEAVAAAPQPNNPATGAPAISGTAQVGETLTADTSGVADVDGLSNVQYEYQWLADDADIAGATGSTYTLSAADEGRAVKVRVSFTDDTDNEETLTSVATNAVAAPEPPAKPRGLSATASHDSVTLTWNDPGDDSITGYVVLRRVRENDQGGDFDELVADTGTAATTYTDYSVVAETTYTYRIKAINQYGASERSRWYHIATPAAPEPAANSPATGSPAITGTAQVGGTLTADTSGIADEDGLENVTFTYQWRVDGTAIAGATANTYKLVEADKGKTVKVRVSFTDDAGNEETLTSAATDAVEAAPTPNNPSTGAPAMAGAAQVGETLKADTSGIADEDGLENVTFGYQWLADDTAIQGATNADYTLVEADEGKTVKVRVSFTDDAGNDETLTSEATAAVAAAPTPNSPATGAPTISGTAQVGETLTANTSGVADTDGLGNVQYEYQWLADDAEIADATGLTYTLADTDEGKAISVRVTFTDDAGNEETLTSGATDAVAAAEPSEPPAKPRGLSATASHDSVTLTWDDPSDDSVTGYVVLRRIRVNDVGGEFSVLVPDTGSAATTYTDGTVAASTTYTYRIKAVNGAGTSERSRWFHIDTPAAP